MNLKEKENRINELKSERAKEWSKGKEDRDDDLIDHLNEEINDLKIQVKKQY